MIYYKLYQDNRRNAANPGAWYARPAAGQVYDLDALAEHMAAHDTPFSKGVIYGVLTDMVECIQELTLQGVSVKIPDLAIFSVGFKSAGADSVKDFSASEHIKAYKLRANKFERDGYVFLGWAKRKDGPVAYKNGQKVKSMLRACLFSLRAFWDSYLTYV